MKPRRADSPSRGRRLSSDERKSLSLDRATHLFAQKGFLGAPIQEIAAACGVSEAMLYKLFGDKRGIYEALIRRKIESLGDAMFPREAVAAGDDELFFSTLFRAAIQRTKEDSSFMRLLLYSALQEDPFVDMFYQAYSRNLVRFVSDYIAARVRQGAYRPVDSRLAALAILGMFSQYLQTVNVYRIREFARIPVEKVVKQYVELVLRGLRAAPAGRKKQRKA
jgi:AcrR family transcriptional regulator